jgi:dihydrofolate synthase/folylpolyglutamate synthase
VNERISVNGENISDADLSRLLEKIEPLARAAEEKTGLAPTQFEIWTAAALLYFKEQRCDYVVLEVGLGGEFDATNIIPENEIAIITRLGLDHTQYLGSTISEVAAAKAGILKATGGTRAVITPRQDDEADAAIRKKADALGINVIVPEYTPVRTEGIYEIFSLRGVGEIRCGISGFHQIENASLAAEAALTLGIAAEHILSGIARAKNPARFELIAKAPDTVYDGGHNENGISALVRSLDRYYGRVRKTVVFACMKDKEIADSLRMLSEAETEFIFTTVKDNPRADTGASLKKRAEALGFCGYATEDIGEAYELARSRGALTVICGSLYLYRDLSEYLNKKNKT